MALVSRPYWNSQQKHEIYWLFHNNKKDGFKNFRFFFLLFKLKSIPLGPSFGFYITEGWSNVVE